MDGAALARAIAPDEVEGLRALLPVGYAAGARAYREAVEGLDAQTMSQHYTSGLAWFHGQFVPRLKARLEALSGGAWDLSRFVGYAAGSDVDLMAHVVEAAAPREGVAIWPGDWYGFLVGATHDDKVVWADDARGRLACVCVPSVRHGQFRPEMAEFVASGEASLLNINLFPTLPASERREAAALLAPSMERALVSVSFSRGFGLTASQLGVLLVHEDHPWRARYDRQWSWFTYFYNALAARAFLALDAQEVEAVDETRRAWAARWLAERGLPQVASGSYYVKSFRVEGEPASHLRPLCRDGVIRLCLKPPVV